MSHENIENLGKGLQPQPPDVRDFNAAFMMAGAAPIEWGVEVRLSEPPNENQRTSDACVAYASSYFHWQLKRKNYSRRDLFSRIALDSGAYLRDGVKAICEVGHQTRDECPDPEKPSKFNMRVKSLLPDSAGEDDKEERYFGGGITMEQMAQGVRDFNGAVFGVYGDSDGWEDKTNPKPPEGQPDWAHALYAFGYHLHDGHTKCIIAKSSWCSDTHHEHHIKEEYFNQGFVFNNWILIPKGATYMIKRYLVEKNGK